MILLESTTIHINERDSNGITALYKAIELSNYEISKLLLCLGALPNVKTKFGYSPLHVASQNGNVKLCELLIINDAYIDIRTPSNYTPLHLSSKFIKFFLNLFYSIRKSFQYCSIIN